MDWAFEQSDHASVAVGMYLKEEVTMGPGLTRINSSELDDPIAVLGVKSDLRVMLLLVKCYDKKMVYVTLQLGHLFVDSASGG